MKTALVTGGSRGVGKGVVEGLCEAGYRVHFSGRDPERLASSEIEATALGGQAIRHAVDHTQDDQVAALFDHIEDVQLLVNCAWGGYENMIEGGEFTWILPYWQQPLWRWDAMMQTGVRSAYVASQHATRAMLARGGGMIVNISYWAAQKHSGNVVYGMAKSATDKMTSDMAAELCNAGNQTVHVISLYPGLVRTERVMESAEFLDLSNSESPRFIGRTIAAIEEDAATRAKCNGQVCIAAEMARALGVTDIDGSSPAPLTREDA